MTMKIRALIWGILMSLCPIVYQVLSKYSYFDVQDYDWIIGPSPLCVSTMIVFALSLVMFILDISNDKK
jgi:hypothetical protein